MTELLEKLRKIDHEIEGEEFTQYGATYFFAFDILEGAADDLAILERYFLELELSPPLNEINLMEIEDSQEDIIRFVRMVIVYPEGTLWTSSVSLKMEKICSSFGFTYVIKKVCFW